MALTPADLAEIEARIEAFRNDPDVIEIQEGCVPSLVAELRAAWAERDALRTALADAVDKAAYNASGGCPTCCGFAQDLSELSAPLLVSDVSTQDAK